MKIIPLLVIASCLLSGCWFNTTDNSYLKARNATSLTVPPSLTDKNLLEHYVLPEIPKRSQSPDIRPNKITKS